MLVLLMTVGVFFKFLIPSDILEKKTIFFITLCASCANILRYYLSRCYSIAWDRLSNQFLRASVMLKHVIDIGWTSVCPSVCPSVRHTLALYQNGSTYRHDFFTAQ